MLMTSRAVVGLMLFALALQVFTLSYQLHMEHRLNAQLLVITLVCSFAVIAFTVGMCAHSSIAMCFDWICVPACLPACLPA